MSIQPYGDNLQKRKIISWDFDATIATYSRPWKLNVLGKPIKKVINALKYHYNKGDYILIFTGRKNNKILRKWLKVNNVSYNGINVQPIQHKDASNFKPYFGCIIDDKAVNPYDPKTGKLKSTKRILWEIDKVLNRGN